MSIFNHFQNLNLSLDQQEALQKLEGFFSSTTNLFILKGYAGSGKTTILEGLVKYLEGIEREVVLMAPTGRAAKVIREKTGQEAFTIHKSIYSYEELEVVEDGETFCYRYKIRNNTDVQNKVFIVDEASMLSDEKSEGEFFKFGTSHLLSDLITFSRVRYPAANSKIIFVGDPCQLPPVTDKTSRAFDAEYLKNKFRLSVEEAEMKEVIRQREDSGISKAALKIRKSISSGYFNDFNLTENGKDIFTPTYETLLDAYDTVKSPKIIIASKNKTCLDLNLDIRERRFSSRELPAQISDIVIMGGNNYRKGIFNGEFAVINGVSPQNEIREICLRGKSPVTLRWRDVELVFPDQEGGHKLVKGKIIENFLYGDNFLKPEETQALYVDFLMRHRELKPKSEAFKEAIMTDEYFNCLLIKYGYAVTCHKAQGGEWENVFTIWDHDTNKEFDYTKDDQQKKGKTNEHFYRWAYTAVTRASASLYTLNPPYFNSYSGLTFVDPDVIKSIGVLTGNNYQPEETVLDDELVDHLINLKLLEQPLEIQDHFIKVRQVVRSRYIEVDNWEKKNFEILYKFSREGKHAAYKTWINGGLKFNGKFLKQPVAGNDEALCKDLETLLYHLPDVTIKRNTGETIFTQIEFDMEVEEKLPFTRNLFDDLQQILGNSGIQVEVVEHLPYKERYTFRHNQNIAVMDFEYDGKGFFGRVVPLAKKCTSEKLLQELKLAIQQLNPVKDAS